MNCRYPARLFVISLMLMGSMTRAEDTQSNTPSSESSNETKEVVSLDPIVTEGTPADSLKFDPIVPAYTAKTRSNLSTGNIGKELANDLPFHFSGFNKPGNEGGVIGIGKGVEETDVNFLGIPINRPQGGGADLSTFPQFIWSGYTYQIGASLGAFDPRGVAGSLTLRLWTQENMGQNNLRFTGFHSTRGIQQTSAALSKDKFAILGGLQTGIVEGGALTASGRVLESEKLRITAHLVATETKSQEFFSERVPGTMGQQRTLRSIPVLQADYKLASDSSLKSSFFHDYTYSNYYRYNRPSTTITRRKTHQIGNETAWVKGATRVGFGFRHIDYSRSGSDAFGANPPTERVLNVQATHGYKVGGVLLEPTLGGTWVTRYNPRPFATFGARHESDAFGGKWGKFLRVGYHQRFPSLLDRYYENVQSAGPTLSYYILPNEQLRTENVKSAEGGMDVNKGNYRSQLTLFAREYQRARITRFTQVSSNRINVQIQNAGDAYVYGATHSNDFRVSSIFDLGTRVTYQQSKVHELNADFAYSPDWVGILKLDFHQPDQKYGLQLVQKLSTNYIVYSESQSAVITLPGYGYTDAFVRGKVWKDVELTAGVENLFDKPIQFRFGNMDEGRIYSFSANALF